MVRQDNRKEIESQCLKLNCGENQIIQLLNQTVNPGYTGLNLSS